MKKCATDSRLIIGLILAHLLFFLTFEERAVFWYIITASMLFLISYSTLNEEIEDQVSFFLYLLYGIVSGIVLFGVFQIGFSFIDLLNLSWIHEISTLYRRYSPSLLWHYIVLLLVIIPGEEIFWRGFVQKRLAKNLNRWSSILITSLLYASVNVYSETFLLPIAALASGIFWGWLYTWKKSIPLVIVSHLIFDLFLFVIFPFQ